MIRTLADQIEARAKTNDPLSPMELRQLAATLRVIANKYEHAADVLPFRRRVTAAAPDEGGAA